MEYIIQGAGESNYFQSFKVYANTEVEALDKIRAVIADKVAQGAAPDEAWNVYQTRAARSVSAGAG